ncbi:MAG: metal ABC transporter substrate-binding protein [Luteolibacter sp.]|uniref:metal ABC transporter substrate-binding protein n=1 Tax=Luteolibacter sp. TaxID=1962973 RepID=UPI0032673706
MLRLIFAIALLGLLPLTAADLKIAVLHPLLGDLARQVGGDKVEVVDLIGPNGDPHHFEAKPEDLRKAEGASIYLVTGMGLEGYMPKLKAIISGKARLVEVGATLPVLEGSHDDDGHGHEIDPHWWHSIDLFRRATGIVTEAMIVESPENAALFRQNAATYRNQLDELERWTRREISKIPRDKRHLATAHAAFNYFCKDFGFVPHPVQGLNREQMPDPAELAALIADLKANHVAAIFPEKESNPKILGTLTNDTGIRLGDPLIADGTGGIGYVAMYRHNVEAIVKGLGAQP